MIVDALKNRYALPILLKRVQLARSIYYYRKTASRKPDKYQHLRQACQRSIYEKSRLSYGYRRISRSLRNDDVRVSEKLVRQLMKEEGLVVRYQRRRKYSSYQGEISERMPILIQRDFHAERPNEKWLTDITEFSVPAGKVYLSPIVDCYDGLIISWSLGEIPDAELVNSSLRKAISTLKKERLIIHRSWLSLLLARLDQDDPSAATHPVNV